ncbi:MAG: hypothetical protein WD768_08845 [Phycisphaeraceae bacterium]
MNDNVTTFPNTQPQRGQLDGSNGQATVLGLWIPPQAMAELKAEQVIDSVDAIKSKTVVSEVGRGYVVISEIGQLHRTDCTYDATSGILTTIVFTKRDQLSTATTQLKLVGQR